MKICLVIIFNHRFDQNLEKLRRLYFERFSQIRFLMPFYDGTDEDVIPVYEHSFQFNGYLIQAYDKLKEIDADYFYFVADDIYLNSSINEQNILEILNLGNSKKAYFYECTPLNDAQNISWLWSMDSSEPFYIPHLNWRELLPDYELAMDKFKRFFGKDYPAKYTDDFFFAEPMTEELINRAKQFFLYNRNQLDIPYPMAKGYSDMFCINKEDLYRFSRMCGILSSMNMFVEIAIPTAVVLIWNREEIVVQDDLPTVGIVSNVFSEEYMGEECKWQIAEIQKYMNNESLFIHPIKLSKWNV